MADIAKYSTDRIKVIDHEQSEIFPAIAGATVAAGDAAYMIAASGKYGLADANGAGLQQARGMVIRAAGDRQECGILKRGKVAGFNVSAMNYDDPVYLSDTAGSFSSTAGTMTVIVGRIVPMSDNDFTKVIYYDFDWTRIWA